ncbi:Pseudouridine synthase [Sulfurovum sp. enrichment culture clone C5]|uniref:Pseudouridine synthase n=1 Tax=Sulfurovum sp. enrichment culture clone C5 TaxID=497650 RepID=A0A0S4XP04_9BACT|nr:Pseudouridine synthase [Sulfurovum sp. enrichment culture clone C5]
MKKENKESFVASEDNRIDKILATHLNVSRNQVEKLIEKGFVSINDKVVTKTSQKVHIDDTVSYVLPEAEQKEAIGVNFDVEILYEDEYLMVINKPKNLVVHPAPSVKEATLVDWLIQKGISLSTISGEERHGIVHRIDKDTTGALVIAKTNEAHEALSRQLEDKTMGRYYLAIIDYPLKDNLIVEANISRNSTNRLKMAIVEDGKFAKSAFAKLLLGKNSIELIAAKLYTGRTHQIRVHLAHLGRHILGDTLYGYKDKEMPRVFLHARLIYFKHPKTNKLMEFEAPLFDDMREFLNNNLEDDYSVFITPKNLKGVFDASH